MNASLLTLWLRTLAIAYLLGSIPFGYLLVRIFRKQDIRATGSGNIGATNVARSGAKGLGILTLLLDLAKGLAAVILAFLAAAHSSTWRAAYLGAAHTKAFDLAVLAAVAAILGHVFPIWLRFRGGKGVATALGVFIALVPLASLCILGVFLAVFLITRYVSLASILAAASFPIFGFFFVRHPSPIVIFGFLFIPILIILKHHANIARLRAGTESRFGSSKSKSLHKAKA
jgi:glycerol-3-phosphate acyltransferase PlsY